MSRIKCCAMAVFSLSVMAFDAVRAQTWTGAGDMIWTQPDSNSFSPEYTSGSTAAFSGAGIGTVTVADVGVTPGAVVVSSGTYTFDGGSIGGTGGLSKSGTGTLILSGTNNTYSGTTTLTAGKLQGYYGGADLNPVSPFGTSSILLNGGTLELLASGSTNSTPETVNFGNDVTVGADATVYVNRVGATSSFKTMGLGTLTIGTNTLSVTAANVNYSAGFSAVTMTGNATFSPGQYATLVLGNITQSGGTYSLTKTGVGTLSLIGTNDYAGGTILTGGVLRVNSDAALGAIGTGITVSGNTTLSSAATASTEYNRAISLGAGTTLTLAGGANTASFSGPIAGSGNLTVTLGVSSSTIALTNTNNTFTGDVLVTNPFNGNLKLSFNSLGDAGMLSLGKNSYQQYIQYTGSSELVLNNRRIDLNSSFASINDGGGNPINMFENNGNGTITFNADMTVAASKTGTFFFGGTNTGGNTYAGVIPNSTGGTLSIGKHGAGKWIVTGNNTFSGSVEVRAGALVLSGANQYTGATTVLAGTLQINSIANYGTDSAIGKGTSGVGIILGNASSTGTLIYTGGAQLTDRFIRVGNNASGSGGSTILNNGTGALTFTAANFNEAYVNTQTQTRNITLGGTNDGIIQGIIQNSSGTSLVGLVKIGTGTWTLQGANTYTGTTAVNAGTLRLQSGATTITQTLTGLVNQLTDGTLISDKSGAGDLSTTFSSYARTAGATGNIVSTGGTNGSDNFVNITGAAGFIDKGLYFGGSEFAARNAINGYVRALNYATTGGDANTADIDTVTASRHVKLSTASYSGAGVTLLSLNLASGGINWTNNSGQTLTSPGILKSGGGSSTISGGNVNGGSNVELVIRTDLATDNLTINSVLNLGNTSAILTKSGAGTLTLGGINTYQGQTHVNAGTLSISANNNLGAEATGATLNLKGGTLQATGTFGLFNGIVGTNNRAVTLLNQSGIEVTGTNTLTIAGVLSNHASAGAIAPGFEKTGTGTLVLSGTNTYTGSTIITAGTLGLVISDSSTSKSFNGLALNGGALELMFTVAPSASVPALRILGELTLGGSATIRLSATPGLLTSGVTYPLLTVIGPVPGTTPNLELNGVSGTLEWVGNTLVLVPAPAGTVILLQ